MCLAGASGAGAELLTSIPDDRLRAYYVWVPMLAADGEAAARSNTARFAEPRARHYWDRERQLSTHLGQALGISSKDSLGVDGGSGLAWDVYLAYGNGARSIERPEFWMHQLAVTHARRLDPTVWHRRISEMLGEGSL